MRIGGHWLGWQCGLDARSARERVRVARALLELAAVREAFAVGALTYSKVRAITRVVTTDSEPVLVEMARHATAAQIERIVAGYRRMGADGAAAANRAYERRRIDTFDDPDGFTARLRTAHDDGAALRGALGQLVDQSLRERPPADGETAAQRRVDVLVDVVVRAAQGGPDTARGATTSPADRHLVVVNVDASVLADDEGAVCALDGGPGLPGRRPGGSPAMPRSSPSCVTPTGWSASGGRPAAHPAGCAAGAATFRSPDGVVVDDRVTRGGSAEPPSSARARPIRTAATDPGAAVPRNRSR